MKNNIEKIYVCLLDDSKVIDKVLIQYVDGNSEYFEIPSFYNELRPNRQEKENKKIEKILKSYMEELAKQNNSSNNYLENKKVIVIKSTDSELKQYVDDQIKNINNRKYYIDENLLTVFGLISFTGTIYCNSFTGSVLNKSFWSILNSILSCHNFKSSTKYNKIRGLSKKENRLLKELRRYFSYFMISLNIGFSITNLSINYKELHSEITMVNMINEKAKIKVDNPFSSDSSSLVTTNDAVTNLIMDSFNTNSFLNEKDLEIALSLKKYIGDNPYFDYEKLYDTFSTISVIHYDGYDKGDTAGEYYEDSNIVVLYKGSYDSEEFYEDALQHEIIHSTGSLENSLLNEGMTSLLQMEYSNDFTVNDSYYDHVLMTKAFCELITPEKMLEAYTKNDMSIIKEEMLKLNSNEEDYNNLMNGMQKYSEEYKQIYKLYASGKLNDDQLPSNYFQQLLKPYLNSKELNEEKVAVINKYLNNVGYFVDVPHKLYFNLDDKDKFINIFSAATNADILLRN